MARKANIIRTADVCDDYADELLVCELPLNDDLRLNDRLWLRFHTGGQHEKNRR